MIVTLVQLLHILPTSVASITNSFVGSLALTIIIDIFITSILIPTAAAIIIFVVAVAVSALPGTRRNDIDRALLSCLQ